MSSHDDLYRAFQQYFKYNQIWLTKGTKRSAMDTRHWLSEIRRICSQRRVEIQDWRHEKDKFKANQKAIQAEDKDNN
jgi:hypothetical protein